MNLRLTIEFLKSPSGRLLIFGVVLGGGLALFGWHRKRSDGPITIAAFERTNATDSPQLIETVTRPVVTFRPPPPREEPRPTTPPSANTTTQPVPPEPKPRPALAPISLVADATAGRPEPKTLGPVYAPYGRLIPCETIITVDSGSIQTPIIGLITEDIFHAGQLVIPAGTEVHGSAQTDHARERISSGTSWTLVWQSGEELRLRALALDREFETSTNQVGWGITDGSAGLRGRLIKSDDLAEIKLFAATFLSGAAKALTEKETTLFGSIDSRSLNNAPLKGAEDILGVYARRIQESIQRDGFYVRVPSGKQFYLYVLQTIDRSSAVLAGTSVPPVTSGPEEATPRAPLPDSPQSPAPPREAPVPSDPQKADSTSLP